MQNAWACHCLEGEYKDPQGKLNQLFYTWEVVIFFPFSLDKNSYLYSLTCIYHDISKILKEFNLCHAQFRVFNNISYIMDRHQKLGYRRTPGDEVEDMYILLREIKRQIPSVAAVSSGAIASDYQRLRVENVCARLGLVSLAYLWKQDQSLLLQEMVISFCSIFDSSVCTKLSIKL